MLLEIAPLLVRAVPLLDGAVPAALPRVTLLDILLWPGTTPRSAVAGQERCCA